MILVLVLNSAVHEEKPMKCETEFNGNSEVIQCQIYLAAIITKKPKRKMLLRPGNRYKQWIFTFVCNIADAPIATYSVKTVALFVRVIFGLWEVEWDEPSGIRILAPTHGSTVFLLRGAKPQVTVGHNPWFKMFLATQMRQKLWRILIT
jgi:hypothetical protein